MSTSNLKERARSWGRSLTLVVCLSPVSACLAQAPAPPSASASVELNDDARMVEVINIGLGDDTSSVALDGQRRIELTRQVTARTRRRLDSVLAAHRA